MIVDHLGIVMTEYFDDELDMWITSDEEDEDLEEKMLAKMNIKSCNCSICLEDLYSAIKKMKVNLIPSDCIVYGNSFVTLTNTSASTIIADDYFNNNKPEAANMQTIEQTQKYYLNDRADSTFFKKEVELQEAFFLSNTAPRTIEELIARIKGGKYQPPKDDVAKQKMYSGYLVDKIDWREKPADRDGYEKAVVALNVSLTKTKDKIMVSDAKEGLAALEAFESATFH